MQLPQISGPERPLSPTGRALAELHKVEDKVGDHDAVLYVRGDGIVVLVDSIAAFGMWVFELKTRRENPVHSQQDVILATAETKVCGVQVFLCRGEFDPALFGHRSELAVAA